MNTINPSYVAIIGDIIDSKNIEHRQEIQTKLLNTLNKSNSKYYKSIVSKFKITLGDEFGGLMRVNGDWTCIIINELFFSKSNKDSIWSRSRKHYNTDSDDEYLGNGWPHLSFGA
ncbi:SatD family protein [Faecalicoccus pleomorphus]|uniref:SatD family protein n=1 Tax=Faecalicoccus pleomorphus TaxID=1323 RepID=UPI003DA40A21